jgi:hypothetical protein
VRRRLAVAALGLLLGAARGAWGQQAAGPEQWSTLTPPAAVVLSPLAPPPPLLLLLLPQRPVSLFWLGGNPGAVPGSVEQSHGSYGFGSSREAGAYRRPLDVPEASALTASVTAWQPLGAHGAAVGRVVLRDQGLDPGGLSHEQDPYGSGPLISSDTTSPPVNRTRALLEGAIGWRLGGWGIGAVLAYDATDNRTHATPLPRIGRSVQSGATLGVVRRLGLGAGLQVGAHARYVDDVEEFSILALGANGTVYQLLGLSEPLAIAITSSQPYYRRFERHASAFGGGASGRVLGATWAAFWQSERRRERQTSDRAAVRQFDRWRADATTWGLIAEGRLPWVGLVVRGGIRRTTLDGTAGIATLEGVINERHEAALDVELSVRAGTADSLWLAGLVIGANRREQRQDDFLAQLSASVATWSPGVTVELARRLGRATAIAAALGYAGRSAVATIPNPVGKGPGYQVYVAPDLGWSATQATARTVTVVVRQRVRAATSVWFGLHHLTRSPTGGTVPGGPETTARRTTTALQLGAVTGL